MPKDVFPKSVQRLPQDEYDVWVTVYEREIDRGNTKQTAAKKAWAAVKKLRNAESGYNKMIHLGANIEILPELGSEAPTDIKLFDAGRNESEKAIAIYDPGKKENMQESEVGRDKLPINFNHSLNKAVKAEEGIAAGWFELSLESDGIWARNIEWTSRAKELIENREYRFTSPEFSFFENVKDGSLQVSEDGRPIGTLETIAGLALTNTPATFNPMPLVASKEHTYNIKEIEEAIEAIKDWYNKHSNISQENESMTQKKQKETEEQKVSEEESQKKVEEQQDENPSGQSEQEDSDIANMSTDEVRELVAQLQQENSDLSEENTQLKSQVSELNAQIEQMQQDAEEKEKEDVMSQMNLSQSEYEFFKELSLEQVKKYSEIRVEEDKKQQAIQEKVESSSKHYASRPAPKVNDKQEAEKSDFRKKFEEEARKFAEKKKKV